MIFSLIWFTWYVSAKIVVFPKRTIHAKFSFFRNSSVYFITVKNDSVVIYYLKYYHIYCIFTFILSITSL